MPVNFKRLGSSFKFALEGLKDIIVEENAFRAELIIGILVVIATFYFHLSSVEKAIVYLVIFIVLLTELVNSVVERIMDAYNKEFDHKVKKIKDVASAIVLLSFILAAIVGALIFADKL